MAYLLTEPLNAAWVALNDRSTKIDTGKTNVSSPQHPLAAFYTALDAWAALYDSTRGSRPDRGGLTVSELEKWTSVLQQQQALVSKVEATYPQRTNGGGGKVVVVPDENVTGALPWWYWPLRIGAGVGTGWFVYRVLKPKEGHSPAFAGVRSRPRR